MGHAHPIANDPPDFAGSLASGLGRQSSHCSSVLLLEGMMDEHELSIYGHVSGGWL